MELLITTVTTSTTQFLLNNILSDSDDESSDEKEIQVIMMIRKKYNRKPSRVYGYLDTVANYTSQEFQHFRVIIEAYESLLRVIGPKLKRKANNGRNTITIEKQVLAVVWLLATPDSYRSVGNRFDMGKSSLFNCFMRVVKVLCAYAPRLVKWPSGQRLQEVKEKFRRIAGLPDVVGCIDGTYVDIKAPKEDPESYITRKSTYAMTLQGICDADLKFTDVFVRFRGSVHDNRIFRNSDIYAHMRNHLQDYFPGQEYIVGDKAYPLLQWCIPPYINRSNLTPPKRNFNTILATTSQTIERTFALLFGRFRRLKFLDMNRLDYIPAAVLAACVLRNICLDHTDLEVDQYIREGLNHMYHNEEHDVDDNVIEPEARDKRHHLCQLLWAARN